MGDPMDPKQAEKIKRGYRACLHCRSRKAKCDLGDINAPSEPPCSRCKRESRECVFAPSRRGGNNRKRRKVEGDEDTEGKPSHSFLRSVDQGSGDEGNPPQTFPYPHPPPPPRHPSVHSLLLQSPPTSRYLPPFDEPSTSSQSSPGTNYSNNPTPHGHGHPGFHSTSGVRNSTPSPHRRNLHVNPPLHASDPSNIVVADMRNESDALQILALASGQAANEEERRETSMRQNGQRPSIATVPGGSSLSNGPGQPSSENVQGDASGLKDFALVKMKIVTEQQAFALSEAYFKCHHHFFPIIPSAIIPRTYDQLSVFSKAEKYLLAAFIIIASRVDNTPEMRDIHDRSWTVMRKWISRIQSLGEPPTIGLVESLLLLAEFLPRTPRDSLPTATPESRDEDPFDSGVVEEPHGVENRQAWQIIGLAVRSAYEMGLDKLGLQLIAETERTLELERAKLAWVYCYLFDRHISIRLGKGFWTRGGSVCFQGYSSSAQTGPAAAIVNFPFLREIKSSDPAGNTPQEDLGSLVQAYLELTMMMSNAHDVLHPNAARTRSLVVYGEYFKYIDEMARSLDGFKILWRRKKWTLFPLTDTVWVMYYYIQLYICAFSFQAHVERATMRGEEEYKILEQRHKEQGYTSKLARPALSLFPRGAAQSPDARYIFQMCDAAREMLHICVDNMYPGGALPYLPSRFLLWFTYGAIVLLKAIYSGAMLRADHKRTLDLIDRLCACFAHCSTDEEYPAVRYGKQLEALRKKLAGLSSGNNTVPQSPNGSQIVQLPAQSRPNDVSEPRTSPCPPTRDRKLSSHPETAEDQDHQNRSNTQASWPQNQPQQSTASWQMPIAQQYGQPVTSPYPSAPSQYAPVFQTAPYVAPPHQQPFMEFGVAQSSDGYNLHMSGVDQISGQNQGLVQGQGQNVNGLSNNLGFATLEDWFGFGAAGTAPHPGQSQGQNGQGGAVEEGMGMAGMGLDLQDFWMNVGPGEAQGGFPFR
ncbi:hypothetical protein L202_07931 [Cryptococcus amylolentus CBS 6039]|uniref:Zn(2)-C6 fungal-type domain-containing protein n=1 Tax=Cryptococcus amylolentus CBS 6039 TaxID=1295533 RepID=A0A1E3HB86_9TREE|nr:hypothetical protein L202_07931 [Cryptococcus amylolentus CBS 6039]ODN73405.1 hypothetical protein L202_07931 [Cryptococcus amylolentus CBS 6039]